MIQKLLKKELLLAVHPASYIMLCLSVMVLIPNYPYSVIGFYSCLGLFFTCLLGRENHDILYSLTLPISKKNIVKGRFASSIFIQGIQLIIMLPFIVMRQMISPLGNQAGVDANIALLGYLLILFGVFNFVFFSLYYKDVNKVGVSFVISTVVLFLCAGIIEACSFFVPFMTAYTETLDPHYMGYKLLVVGIGCLVYFALTALAYKKSVALLEKQDI